MQAAGRKDTQAARKAGQAVARGQVGVEVVLPAALSGLEWAKAHSVVPTERGSDRNPLECRTRDPVSDSRRPFAARRLDSILENPRKALCQVKG